ncbi:MAG: DUF58 domain-containing protein [Myxococcota bacterium]
MNASSAPHLIDAKTLAEIESLHLRARVVADSILAGVHRSRHHGTSAEFAEHKEYAPGDDLRNLDWRAYARLDRDFVKRFEDESNLRALCVVDSSGSMGYPVDDPSRLSKLAYACTCAAALTYVLARQGDAVGFASYAETLHILVPARARRGHTQELLAAISTLAASGPSRLQAVIDTLAEGLRQRTIVIIFSDLLDGGLEALDTLARLRARGHDVAVFHVMDPDELQFPFEDTTRFTSLEDDREVQIDGRAIRNAYLDEVQRFRRAAAQRCAASRVDYRLAPSDTAPGRLLADFLNERLRSRATVR